MSQTEGHAGTESLLKEIGTMWQNETLEEKRPCEEMAKKAKEKCDADMKAFHDGFFKAFIEGELAEYVARLEAADSCDCIFFAF